MQQQLSKQMNEMKNRMEKMGKKGKEGKQEQSGLNQQIARMAAQQEALRSELQKYQDKMLEEGRKDGGNLTKTMNEMEENEKDLINKSITMETQNRQQRILSRMLESEKAEETREQDEKRESHEAKNVKISNPKSNFQYKRVTTGNNELLQYAEPTVSYFYKDRVNNYLIKIGR